MTERQSILLGLSRERDKAELLLHQLLDAASRGERAPARAAERGIDRAIAGTRRMIETLNRQIEQFKNSVTEEDLWALERLGAQGRSRSTTA